MGCMMHIERRYTEAQEKTAAWHCPSSAAGPRCGSPQFTREHKLIRAPSSATVIARLYDGVSHLAAHLKVYSRLGNLVRDDHHLRPMERSIANFYSKWGYSISKDKEWRPDRFTRGPDGGQATLINAT